MKSKTAVHTDAAVTLVSKINTKEKQKRGAGTDIWNILSFYLKSFSSLSKEKSSSTFKKKKKEKKSDTFEISHRVRAFQRNVENRADSMG